MLNKKVLLPVLSTIAVLIIALGVMFGYKAVINSKIQSGEKQITVEVLVDANGKQYNKTYKFWTEATLLGKALDEEINVGVVTDPTFGRYIVSVDGYEQDSANGLYWSIYINEEMGALGMDSQPIAHGDVIRLELKPFTME